MNRKILIIGAGSHISGIAAHLEKMNLHHGITTIDANTEIEAFKKIFQQLESENHGPTIEIGELIAKGLEDGIYNLSDEMRENLGNLGAAIGLHSDEMIRLIGELKTRFDEPKTDFKKEFRDLEIAVCKEPLKYHSDPKVEQFENKNLGAKIGGRKHKKNPFSKGGRKW